MAWETIIERCHHSITKDAIAEASKLCGKYNLSCRRTATRDATAD
jgi:hypothetical protein